MVDHGPVLRDSERGMKQLDDPSLPATNGHHLPANDPDSPMNWPMVRRLYVSLVSWLFTAVVGFGLTSYTVAIPEIMVEFNISMPVVTLGFSLYIFGIFFASIHTPHWSERFGRKPVYLVSLFLCMLFTLGASRSRTWSALAATRFFAGLCGGPCLVLIEGTFADVWSVCATNTYYSFLAAAANVGAGLGPIVLGFVVPVTSWRWTQYVSLMAMFAAFLFGVGMPETYPRRIVRTRAKRAGRPDNLPKAESGVTLAEMAKVTIIDPLIMLVSEPIVIMSSLLLGANFGFLFQWFITVPVALGSAYSFTIQSVGLAFTSALAGTVLALTMSVLLDMLFRPRGNNKKMGMLPNIEYRLYPAMIGAPLMMAALFWVGNTAKPTVNYIVPIVGTTVYVWGSMSALIGIIAYLFDAYPPKGTLAALTAVACFRIALAGVIPLVVIQSFMRATPMWTLGAFGFAVLALSPVPFVMFFFGQSMRKRSRYNAGLMDQMMQTQSPEMETHTTAQQDSVSPHE
ncbi:hypothetical protein EPUS_08887 [Endocarpon pusillum Z07020]|uniref:Major facilitator superfamily (MFS) profile domain-containing protein n=1 Tax=Endocarpon pusillum (strain Z07020 / HMAS-L-300199) TaxID=1263415 RepID=U1GPE0_ENDPU|nr:uncharacterized protein EPUS_08887 [Endocarpon pusillum Z07020]ERF74148.1 hypothetical protein EPUS_08887 [Endocarpon pusillum Z07020]